MGANVELTELKRIQVYLPEPIRFRYRMSDCYNQDVSESSNVLRLIMWAIENNVSLDE